MPNTAYTHKLRAMVFNHLFKQVAMPVDDTYLVAYGADPTLQYGDTVLMSADDWTLNTTSNGVSVTNSVEVSFSGLSPVTLNGAVLLDAEGDTLIYASFAPQVVNDSSVVTFAAGALTFSLNEA